MDAIDNCKVQFGGSGKLFEPMDQITNDAVVSHAQLAFPNQIGILGCWVSILSTQNYWHLYIKINILKGNSDILWIKGMASQQK